MAFGDRPISISHEEQIYYENLSESKYPYYVTMVDSFMSHWGKASGRAAFYVYGARSLEEADAVAANAKRRGDQKYVRIVRIKPRANPMTQRLEFVEPGDKSYSRWYTPNGFKGEK